MKKWERNDRQNKEYDDRSTDKEDKEKEPIKKDRESVRERYSDLLRDYNAEFEELKKLQRRFKVETDPELLSSKRVIDKERDRIHKELILLGKKIDKSEYDVLVDIIRQRKTLEEYGLPEFMIMKSSDFMMDRLGVKDREHNFNINFNTFEPGLPKTEDDFEGDFFDGKSVAIVYSITPVMSWGATGYIRVHQKDDALCWKRAHDLAEEVGGEVLNLSSSEYHDTGVDILTVIIPKERLERVISIIRNNAMKFRIGGQFYTKEEKEKAERDFWRSFQEKEEDGGYRWILKDKKIRDEYFLERQKLYGEKPPTEEEIKELLK